VLISSYLESEHINRIRAQVPAVDIVYRPDLIGAPRFQADHTAPVERTPEQEAEWRALLAESEILFDFDHSHREDLPALAPKLKWIQATSAGIGQAVKRYGYDQTGWRFTTASGAHARPLAEYCLMVMLMFIKNYPVMDAQKRAHHWQRFNNTELRGLTVGIVGLGRIGREIAQVCKTFGMRVLACRRSQTNPPRTVDALFAPDLLDYLLPQADFVVLCAPHTPDTDDLLSAERIRLMKAGAILINIARGALVDHYELKRALR
jgi:phosphoglycerate dehydrogenase-like enzyme